MLDKIIYTLNRLSIRGKDNLRACVACKNTLLSPETCDAATLRAVLAELDSITVSGEDAGRLLGCMQAVEELLKEVTRDEADHEQG